MVVTSCKLWITSCKLQFYENKLVSLGFLFMSCQVILQGVANLFCEFEIKLWVISRFLRVTSCFSWVANLRNNFISCKLCFMTWKFKNFILQVPSCPLQDKSLRWQIYRLKV